MCEWRRYVDVRSLIFLLYWNIMITAKKKVSSGVLTSTLSIKREIMDNIATAYGSEK